MTELEKIERAKMYIDKLANGFNPLDNSAVPEDEVVNNVRISRCLFYVSDILQQVIENKSAFPIRNKDKVAFSIDFDTIQKFPFSDEPIPVSKIAQLINSLIDTENMKKITYKGITEWLISIGMLMVETRADGKTTKMPTSSGNEMGIYTETRLGRTGNYTVVLYNRIAQQFLIDNMDAIISFINMN